MDNNKPSVLIVGAGAIGGITAGVLAKEGNNITLLCKGKDLADKIQNDGLKITGKKGKFTIKVPAVSSPDALSGKFDIAMIATKAPELAEAAKSILPFLNPDSLVVSLQNGICIDFLSDIAGKERTAGCSVGWGATMKKPGELEMTSSGEFIIGMPGGNRDERMECLRQMLSNIVPVKISPDIMSSLYSKLIINSCISSLGAVCGLMLGNMLKLKMARDIFIAVIREAVAVSNAIGLKVEIYAKSLNYYNFLKGNSIFSGFKRHLILRVIGLKYRNLKSSSLQSLERGRKTEVDYFNGYIAKKGKEFGIGTPVNLKIIKIIKEIEDKKRQISIDNIIEIVSLLNV